MSETLHHALVRRIRQAARIADDFWDQANNAAVSPEQSDARRESALMWENTYDQLMAVLFDLVESKGDQWMQLINQLEKELGRG